MTTSSSTLTLDFGFGTNVLYTKRIEISADNSGEPKLLQRIWAEKKITELNLDPENNKDRISLLGKKYGIVTENTSLLVLENLSDYLEYNIIPPKEMQKEFFSQKKAIEKEASEKSYNHIEYIVKLLDEQSKWWSTNYPVSSKKLPNNNKPLNDQLSDSLILTTDASLSEVVVTGYGTQRRSRLTGAVSGVNVNRSRRESEALAVVVSDELIDATSADNEANIHINAWDPQTPYLKVLQYAKIGEEYNTYLKLKKEYGTTPAFYIDASDFFAKAGNNEITLRILSNLAELKIESVELLRILANKLLALNDSKDAVLVFKKVLNLKSEEPQSHRDLGLAYEAYGDTQQAIKTLYEVVKRDWNNRFPGIEIIVMNLIIHL
jgi:tetratricopeptide (TPR) repeat protein